MSHRADSQPDGDETAIFRTLDASANRAGEGLRVVEDYVRFALDDRTLTCLCKELRHELAAALSSLPSPFLHKSRDTEDDVGTTLTHEGESRRESAWDVCVAALKRTQQSLRSLEEFSKTLSNTLPQQFERLRYRCYTLERGLGVDHNSRERLADARLYVLVAGQPSIEKFSHVVTALVAGGADLIQLRDKKLDDRRLVERARLLKKLTTGTKTLAIINDRPDIAALSDAHGVHLGQEELSVKDARAIVGCRRMVGVSTHIVEQVRQAVLDGADYLGAGPTFPSATKKFDSFPGLDFLSQAAQETSLPVFAIGGVSPENLDQVLATGIRRVAIGSAIVESQDPQVAAAQLAQTLSQTWNSTTHDSTSVETPR